MRGTLLCLSLLLFLPGCGGSSGDTDDPVLEDPPINPQLGMRTSTITDENGVATTSFGGREAGVLVVDLDSEEPVSGLEVRTVELARGTFVWTESSEGEYFSGTDFVPLGFEGQMQPSMATVSSRISVVATAAVATAIFEYAVEPPGIDLVLGDVRDAVDDGEILRECRIGDLDDILGAQGVPGLTSVTTGIIRAVGAPARLRGLSNINTGFNRAGPRGNLVAEAFEEALGIVDTDVQNICWPVVSGRPLPVLQVSVDREELLFDIDEIVALDTYPPFPSRFSITTSFDVSWSGSPQFPVTLELENNTCFPNVTCNDGRATHREEVNPIVQIFGCVSSDPATRSGFTRWTVRLTDSNGLATSPGTLVVRCGRESADP